jgi:hypothetical protein
MGNLVFQATLGGQVNLVGPNTASTFNLNVPAVAGTLITSGDSATVSNTMLAGSIANAKLLNSSVTVGSTAIALGATSTTLAGLTSVASNTLTSAASTALTLQSAGTTAVTIDTSQRVGIGTTSTSNATLTVNNADLTSPLYIGSQSDSLSWGGFFVNGATSSTAGNGIYGKSGASFYYNVATGLNHIWTTNGVEKMRIDSAGNVGIGTTSPAAKFHSAGGVIATGTASAFTATAGIVDTSSGNVRLTATGADASTYGVMTFNRGSSNAGLFQENMRIDSSGNVGIGTASPSNKLAVSQTVSGADAKVRFFNTATAASSASVIDISNDGDLKSAWRYNNNTGDTDFGNLLGAYNLKFYTNATERMRILSTGQVLIDRTTNTTNGKVEIYGNSDGAFNPLSVIQGAAGSTSTTSIAFYRTSASAVVGTIQTTNTATSYNTSSDYRLKENVAQMTGALAKVAQLKPVTYKWKIDGSDGEGFIAHELAEVCPYAVNGTKDAVDAEGNPQYQGIDTSFLVATLTAALQETKALIDTQAETINALTARIVALEAK